MGGSCHSAEKKLVYSTASGQAKPWFGLVALVNPCGLFSSKSGLCIF